MKMIKLSINPDKLPRTTTREQWRELHRWLRVSARIIRERLKW